ncbi:MAG: YHS domain-containing (seleno)protein [Magnetospiraceae bacterium]
MKVSDVRGLRWAAVRRLVFVLMLVAFAGLSGSATATEISAPDGVALGGFDAVTYFNGSEPEMGDAKFSAQYKGATFHFASAEIRDKFLAAPTAFAPQYGGYCAFATAMARKIDADPQAYRVVNGKLYLNADSSTQDRWIANMEGFIRGADHNWPIIKGIPDADLAQAAPEGISLGPIE